MPIRPLTEVLGEYLRPPSGQVPSPGPQPAASPPETGDIITSFLSSRPPTPAAPSTPSAPTLAQPTQPRRATPRPAAPTPEREINPLQAADLGLKGLSTANTIRKLFGRPTLAEGVSTAGNLAKLAGSATKLAGGPKSLSDMLTAGGSTADIVRAGLKPGALTTLPGGLSLAGGIVGAGPGIARLAGVDVPPEADIGAGLASNTLQLGSVIATQVPPTAAAGTAGIVPTAGLLAPVAAVVGIAMAIKAIGDMHKADWIKHWATQAERDMRAMAQHPAIVNLQQNLAAYGATGNPAAYQGLKDAVSLIEYVGTHAVGALGGVSGAPDIGPIQTRFKALAKPIFETMATRPAEYEAYLTEQANKSGRSPHGTWYRQQPVGSPYDALQRVRTPQGNIWTQAPPPAGYTGPGPAQPLPITSGLPPWQGGTNPKDHWWSEPTVTAPAPAGMPFWQGGPGGPQGTVPFGPHP